MRRRPVRPLIALGAVALLLAGDVGQRPLGATASTLPPVLVQVHEDSVRLQNTLVERRWSDTPSGFRTIRMRDLRTPQEWAPAAGSREFTLRFTGLTLTSDDFELASAEATRLRGGGVRVTMRLEGPAAVSVDQIVEAYPRVAGFRTRLVLHPVVPLVLERYSMAEFTPRPAGLVPTGQTFHSGSDWRDEEDWSPRLQIGGEDTPRAGRSDWRVQTSGPAGGPYDVAGNFISVAARPVVGPRLFIASERPNLPSSRVSFARGRLAADADIGRDVLSFGPIESDVHVENPTPVPVRRRALLPARPLELEPAFVGVATSRDDEPWQFAKFLRAAGWDYPLAVTFNTNTIDDDSLPSNSDGGAKDSVDIVKFKSIVPEAAAMGIETFILDDGWQLNSGDWEPDPTRFPKGLEEVRDLLARRGMKLGLWMSPLSFHPNSRAFRRNPTWSCAPVGTATGGANATLVGEAFLGGSAEAGIGVWNPDALGPDGVMIEDLESKIERAITEWGAAYFKFDFLVWLDCVNPSPVDLYRYRESFVAMIDRLHARHPDVTFQIDETNDYRNWPYESVVRGPSWFQNGAPTPNWMLHNLWTVAPYVPTHSIGQAALGGSNPSRYSVDYLMATSLLSHITFWKDLDDLTPQQVAEAREWTDLYRRMRNDLERMVTYPLLSDPAPGKAWAALQPWDADAQRGYLLAFRQDTRRVTRTIPLRGIKPGRTFRVTDVVTGKAVGTFSSARLVAGIRVSAPSRHSARVLKITRV